MIFFFLKKRREKVCVVKIDKKRSPTTSKKKEGETNPSFFSFLSSQTKEGRRLTIMTTVATTPFVGASRVSSSSSVTRVVRSSSLSSSFRRTTTTNNNNFEVLRSGRRRRTNKPISLSSRFSKPKTTVNAAEGSPTSSTSQQQPQPAFIPAHERQTLSKIPPEQLASGGMRLSAQNEDFKVSFRRFLAYEFMSMDETYDETKISVLNLDPPIFTVEEFISEQECDNLVLAAKTSGGLKVSAIGGGAANENIRTSKTVALNSHGLENHASKKAILASAEKLLPDIRGLSTKKNAFKAPAGGKSEWAFELPQVAHYSGGEYFKKHEDAFPIGIATEKGYQRRATVLVYLNDVPNGGVTRFEYLDLDVQPKKGKCLVFFPASVAAMPDPRTLHTATEAENGCEKWVSQLWVSHSTPPASAGSSDNSASAGQPADVAPKKLNRAQRRIQEREEAKAARKKK